MVPTSQLCLHGLAIGIGIAVAYPLERALREIALLQLQESVHQQTKLEEELHLALHESKEARMRVDHERLASESLRKELERKAAEAELGRCSFA